MNQWIIGGLLFQCHYFHFYLQWESVFWFVLWFQCLPGLIWKRMELLLRGLKEVSDLTGCVSIKFVKGRTAFSRRAMWTFFGDGGVHIQASGNIKGCWFEQSKKEEMPAELVCVSPNQESSKNNRYCGYKSQYLLFFDEIAGVMGPGRWFLW